MSYNGSGVFNINTSGQPVVTGTVISSTAFNALTADLGTGLSTAITKDGQTVATARIPFAQGINSSLVTDATSTTTGSIITAGGVGIAKALYVGTTLNVAGASTLAAITGTFNGTVGATTPSTGAFTTLSATKATAGDVITFTNAAASNKTGYFYSDNVYVGFSAAASIANNRLLFSVGNWAMLDAPTNVYAAIAGSAVGTFSSTGLAVTGTLSATNTITAKNPNVAGDQTLYRLEGATNTTTLGSIVYNQTTDVMTFGSDVGAPLVLKYSGSEKARITSTGLAVTGTLSATGTLSGGTSGTGYSFSGSAAAGSLTLNSSGYLGIGTSSPTALLTVSGVGSTGLLTVNRTDGSGFININSANGVAGAQIGCTGGQGLQFYTNIATSSVLAINVGSSGIVTMSAYGAGAATFSAAGVISSVSDETWKIKDGVPVDTDAMLNKLEPGYWYYNDEKKETFGKDRQLGFYAQNVNAAIGPEAAPEPETVVTKNDDGTETSVTKPWGYYDRSVLAVTVMSLQKALATIESLTARITALENK